MTYNQFIQAIDNFCSHHYFIRSFRTGVWPMVEQNLGAENLYPMLYMVPQRTTLQRNTIRMTMRFILLDIIRPDEANLNDVWSDNKDTLLDLARYLRDQTDVFNLDGDPFLDNVFDRTSEKLAGLEMNIVIELTYPNGCNIPFSEIPEFIEREFPIPLTCDSLAQCSTFQDVIERLDEIEEQLEVINNTLYNGATNSIAYFDSNGELTSDPTKIYYDGLNISTININPLLDDTYDLGTVSLRWRNIYSTNGYFNTLIINGITQSGSNTGDVTLSPVGNSPNIYGATLSGQILNLEPASSLFPGVVTTLSQTFSGSKQFNQNIILGTFSQGSVLFIDANSTVIEDNPNFYYDKTSGLGNGNQLYISYAPNNSYGKTTLGQYSIGTGDTSYVGGNIFYDDNFGEIVRQNNTGTGAYQYFSQAGNNIVSRTGLTVIDSSGNSIPVYVASIVPNGTASRSIMNVNHDLMVGAGNNFTTPDGRMEVRGRTSSNVLLIKDNALNVIFQIDNDTTDTFSRNHHPLLDNTYDLGRSNLRWRNVFASNGNFNTISVGTISSTVSISNVDIVGTLTATQAYINNLNVVTGSFSNIILGTYTPGSVIFVGASSSLEQNNANFFWDNTNSLLRLRGSNSGDGLVLSDQRFLAFANTSNVITNRFRAVSGGFQFQNSSFVTFGQVGESTSFVSSAFGVGTSSVPVGRLHVVGSGNTSGTWTAQFHNSTGASNAFLIRDDGAQFFGTNTVVVNTAQFNFRNSTSQPIGMSLATNNTSQGDFVISNAGTPGVSNGATIRLGKADGTLSSPSSVGVGRVLSTIITTGFNNSSWNTAATHIRSTVDAATGTNIVPGRWEVLTSNSSGTLTTAIYVDSSQRVAFNNMTPVTTAAVAVRSNSGGSQYAQTWYESDGVTAIGGVRNTNTLGLEINNIRTLGSGGLTVNGNASLTLQHGNGNNGSIFIGDAASQDYTVATTGTRFGAQVLRPFTLLANSNSTSVGLAIGNNFNASAATSSNNYTAFLVSSTINNPVSGGITRLIHLNPTVTSASDLRAFENSVGNILLNTTSGNVGIGLSSSTFLSSKFHVISGTSRGIISNSAYTGTSVADYSNNFTGTMSALGTTSSIGYGTLFDHRMIATSGSQSLYGVYINPTFATNSSTSTYALGVNGDLVITPSTSGAILTSPNGSRWRVQIDNSGALTTTAL